MRVTLLFVLLQPRFSDSVVVTVRRRTNHPVVVCWRSLSSHCAPLHRWWQPRGAPPGVDRSGRERMARLTDTINKECAKPADAGSAGSAMSLTLRRVQSAQRRAPWLALVVRQSSSTALTCPVVGSRNTRPALCSWSKSNNPFSEPAIASLEPSPMRGSPQLSSMKRITED